MKSKIKKFEDIDNESNLVCRDAEKDFQILIVSFTGNCKYYYSNTQTLDEPNFPFWAIGSGEKFAFDAMNQGSDAIAAIRVACAQDPNSGIGIEWFNVKTHETGKIAL